MLTPQILVGKSVLLGLKLLGKNGSTLPGLVVEKLSPDFLAKSLGQLPQGMVIVTGTNGKTTTTKIIAELLRAHGLRVISNETGSNFVRGIISSLIKQSSLTGKLPYDIAIFEQDEAHAVQLIAKFQPTGVVVLNVSRDQMDRFGEIDTTAKLIGKVVATAKDWVVLNANDHRVAELQKDAKKAKKIWFGHTQSLLPKFISDDQHYQKEALKFYEAAPADVCLMSYLHGEIKVKQGSYVHEAVLRLDGAYNALNVTAALAAISAILPHTDFEQNQEALALLEPAFGRGEKILLKSGATLQLQLVKNPSGFSHSLSVLKDEKFDTIAIAINDDYADGRDVSWLWDVDFTAQDMTRTICGGVRAYDMALRLKYDNFKPEQIYPDINKFLGSINDQTANGEQAIIYCTYTAMLALRKRLQRYAVELGEGLV